METYKLIDLILDKKWLYKSIFVDRGSIVCVQVDMTWPVGGKDFLSSTMLHASTYKPGITFVSLIQLNVSHYNSL